MGDNDVDLVIRLKGDVETRVAALFARLSGGGAILARFGSAGSAAMQALSAQSANLSAVFGGLGRSAAAVGEKLNGILDGALHRMVSLAKYAVMAGGAFAGWQIAKGVQFNAQLEQTTVALGVMYRSTALANSEIARMLEFSKRTPFQFEEITQTGRMLEAFGLTAKKWLPIVGDLAAGVNAPIQDVARSFGMLAGGRAGEAMRSLVGYGVNLRSIPGLKFGAGGEMETSTGEALEILRNFVAQRYGGMMEKQSTTFSGALSTLKDNIAIIRGQITEGVFERLRAKLIAVNAWMDKIGESAGFRRFVSAISSALTGAFDLVERIFKRMSAAFAATGNIGAALKSGWAELRDAAQPALDWIVGALSRVVAEGIKLGMRTVMSDPLLAAVFGLMIAPKISALTGLARGAGTVLTGLGGLFGLGRGVVAGAAAGAAARVAPSVIAAAAPQVIPGLIGNAGGAALPSIAAGAGAGGATAAGGAASLAFLTPVAIAAAAAAVGWLGAKGITAYSEHKAAAAYAEQNQAYQVRLQREQIEKFALEERTLANTLKETVAQYVRVQRAQAALDQALIAHSDQIGDLADQMAQKFRSPAQQMAALEARRSATLEHRAALEPFGNTGLSGSAEEQMEAISANLRERARLTEDIAKTELEIFAIQEQQRQKVIEANRSYAERLILMSPEESAEVAAITQYMKGGTVEKFMGMDVASRQIYRSTPAGEALFSQNEAALRRDAEQIAPAAFAPEPEARSPEAVVAARSAEVAQLRELGAEFAKSLGAQLKSELAENLQREYKITLEPGTIDALIRLDATDQLVDGIRVLLDGFRNDTVAAAEAQIKQLIAALERGGREAAG